MAPPAEPPAHIAPMLARAGELPADPQNWSFEVKWDGVRALAHLGAGGTRLESRTGRDISRTYPELTELPEALSGHTGTVLDGEVIASDARGRPSFGLLQQRMNVGSPDARLCARVPVSYVVFDLLYLDGEDLTERPYRERRAALEGLGISGGAWSVPEVHPGQGAALLEATRQHGLEGIVAKRLDSAYRPGARGGAWRKLKHSRRQELVIGGWLPGEGRRAERIGALLMGHPDSAGRFIYDGRVGTGFSDGTLTDLASRLAPLVQPDSPFDPRLRLPAHAVYVAPELVAEIEYTERTADGLMRAPSFKGLRDDKAAADVVLEEPDAAEPGRPQRDAGVAGAVLEEPCSATPGASRRAAPGALGAASAPSPGAADGEITFAGRRLNISNHAKVLYPETGFTKGQLIDYYAAVAPVLLGHLTGRALTLKRYPDGVDASFFYEKNSPGHRPDWVPTARIGDVDYTLCDEPATLVWLANLADLELHTSLARAAAPACPTLLAFDLDPGAPAGLIECGRVALVIRGLFDQLGLISAVKTSGNKGLQVYVPINDPEITYAQTKPLARDVAELLARRLPEQVTAEMTKSKRTGRVFVDWSQNDTHKTTVTVYSLRATPRPSVSTPLHWEELAQAVDGQDPAALRFGPEQVLARVAEHGDLFAPVLERRQTLPALR